MTRAFILAPLLAVLAGCTNQTHPDLQPHHRGARVEAPVQIAPDANIVPCSRFERPRSTPLDGGMSFVDANRFIVLHRGEECRTSGGYLMGVER
jgi:hypothetical protein